MKGSLPFGLDIGATSIKVVYLSKQRDGYKLNSALTYPTPPKGMLSESPLDQEEMVQALNKVIEIAKIPTKNVNIALPENLVYTRVIEMPHLSEKELAAAIYWEAEQYIPVPLLDIVLDWKVLNRPQKQGDKMQVLLVGAPNVLIEKFQKILKMAGLEIVSIETEVLSAVRALAEAEGERFPTSVIVQIGSVNTALVIAKKGIIVFSYSIPMGGAAINRALASDFGLSENQAEEYKKTYGVTEKALGGKITKTTENVLMFILTEVKKALAFYSEKYKLDDPIKQIILSGGSARLPGIDLYFVRNLGIETIIANPWKVLFSQQISEEMQRGGASFVVSVGLAMRGYE